MFEINLLTHGKAHARTLVDDQLATQVGFFLIAFHEEFLRAAIEFPIDMANRFARVVEAMFGKLDRKTVEGAFVQACDKPFHDLSR